MNFYCAWFKPRDETGGELFYLRCTSNWASFTSSKQRSLSQMSCYTRCWRNRASLSKYLSLIFCTFSSLHCRRTIIYSYLFSVILVILINRDSLLARNARATAGFTRSSELMSLDMSIFWPEVFTKSFGGLFTAPLSSTIAELQSSLDMDGWIMRDNILLIIKHLQV